MVGCRERHVRPRSGTVKFYCNTAVDLSEGGLAYVLCKHPVSDVRILLSAGAGGQTGWVNPFAFVRAVRQFFDGTVVLAGGIADGVGVRAAKTLGADLAYMGTRFLATIESMAPAAYKDMVAESDLDDVTLTSVITGLLTNMLRPSLEACGIDTDAADLTRHQGTLASLLPDERGEVRNWRATWSAGHSVSGVSDIPSVAALAKRILDEYGTCAPR